MESSSSIPPHHKHTQYEDNCFRTQLKTIFQYLSDKTATASMIEEATGIPQKNICRYKRDLEKAGKLWEVLKTNCKRTGFKAWYLTTDSNRIPPQDQLTLF